MSASFQRRPRCFNAVRVASTPSASFQRGLTLKQRGLTLKQLGLLDGPNQILIIDAKAVVRIFIEERGQHLSEEALRDAIREFDHLVMAEAQALHSETGALLINAKKLEEPDKLRTWALNTESRLHRNKAVCAIANKLARIAWAVWNSGEEYSPSH